MPILSLPHLTAKMSLLGLKTISSLNEVSIVTVVLCIRVLLSALVKKVGVSRMRDFSFHLTRRTTSGLLEDKLTTRSTIKPLGRKSILTSHLSYGVILTVNKTPPRGGHHYFLQLAKISQNPGHGWPGCWSGGNCS